MRPYPITDGEVNELVIIAGQPGCRSGEEQVRRPDSDVEPGRPGDALGRAQHYWLLLNAIMRSVYSEIMGADSNEYDPNA